MGRLRAIGIGALALVIAVSPAAGASAATHGKWKLPSPSISVTTDKKLAKQFGQPSRLFQSTSKRVVPLGAKTALHLNYSAWFVSNIFTTAKTQDAARAKAVAKFKAIKYHAMTSAEQKTLEKATGLQWGMNPAYGNFYTNGKYIVIAQPFYAYNTKGATSNGLNYAAYRMSDILKSHPYCTKGGKKVALTVCSNTYASGF